MTVTWDGITLASTLNEEWVAARHALADAARDYDWDRVFELLDQGKVPVNTWRPDGKSLFTPLHQAAHGGAPVGVVEKLIAMGAWRSLESARGERPADIAARRGHTHLTNVLEPQFRHQVPPYVLRAIQTNFQQLIRARAQELVEKEQLRLPELAPLLELDEPQMWFPIPGMYGGFSFRLAVSGIQAKLVSESWSRVVGQARDTKSRRP